MVDEVFLVLYLAEGFDHSDEASKVVAVTATLTGALGYIQEEYMGGDEPSFVAMVYDEDTGSVACRTEMDEEAPDSWQTYFHIERRDVLT
jgi:hypothetical protein